MFENNLTGRRILLGITGGIAAYKTPELVRLLKKAGAEVQVILSKGARPFVGELSLETVSGNPVYSDCAVEGQPMLHIDLARWAQDYVIAPLSANRLAALVHGFADDLLTTTVLATQARLWVAPAMNKQMWENPLTQSNIEKCHALATIIGPETGEQACLDNGFGRMSEPEQIVSRLIQESSTPCLAGKTVMITAGPTREAIDPVRFLSNRSSGKMGYHLAEQAASLGAKVILVSGPTALTPPPLAQMMPVVSAKDMYETVLENIQGVDIFIGAAAVADYRVLNPARQKMKKQQGQSLHLEMVENPDILSTVAAQPNRPFCVGFAAETANYEAHALEKLERKSLDMIALNAVDQPGVGFDSEDNALSVFWQDKRQDLPKQHKASLAHALLQLINEKANEKES